MAKPKPSFALKHPFFLEAECTRRQCKKEHGSPDVFWIRLALKEREIQETDGSSDGRVEGFQQELGAAIFLGGLGSAKRFESARECIRGEDASGPPDDMDYFDAYFGCCEELRRLPTLAEMRRRFHDAKLKPKFAADYQRKHGRGSGEGVIDEMLDKNWREREGNGVPDRTSFRNKCRSLGLFFCDGSDRLKVERLCRELGFSLGEPVDFRPLLDKISEEPGLKKYLLPNWGIEEFFWWWKEWASEESASILDKEHAGLTYLVDFWSGHVRQWMGSLTRDGAVPIKPTSSIERTFWRLADGEKRPPSVPELLVEMSGEDLIAAVGDCWCGDVALKLLRSVRDELMERYGEVGDMQAIEVAHIQSLVRVLQPYQEIHAFQYTMARMGFEVR